MQSPTSSLAYVSADFELCTSWLSFTTTLGRPSDVEEKCATNSDSTLA